MQDLCMNRGLKCLRSECVHLDYYIGGNFEVQTWKCSGPDGHKLDYQKAICDEEFNEGQTCVIRKYSSLVRNSNFI